jgi:hypothetical protein
MAPRVTPSAGSKPDKLMRDAIMIALNREAKDADGKPTRKLNRIVDKLVDLAIDGDIQAIKEIADRVDGKATQPLASDAANPVELWIGQASAGIDAKISRLISERETVPGK